MPESASPVSSSRRQAYAPQNISVDRLPNSAAQASGPPPEFDPCKVVGLRRLSQGCAKKLVDARAMTPRPDRAPWRVPPALATVRESRQENVATAPLGLYAAPSCQDAGRRPRSAGRSRYVGPDPRPSLCQSVPDGWLSCRGRKAERACPGHPIILCQAATAALLDRRPDKAQHYLKRNTKRYAARKPYYLLSALTLAAQKKLVAARAMLERHDLTNWRMAMGSFPGGWQRRHWLAERLDTIMGRERPTRTRKPAIKPAPVQGRPKSPCRPNPPHRRQHKHGRRLSRQYRPSSGCSSIFR